MRARYESWPRAVLANSRAAPAARLVLVALAAGCTVDGVCSLPIQAIVALTALSRSTAQRAMGELISTGELFLLTPARGPKHPARYRIEVPRVERYHGKKEDRKGVIHQTLSSAKRVSR